MIFFLQTQLGEDVGGDNKDDEFFIKETHVQM